MQDALRQLVDAIRSGDVEGLGRILAAEPSLAAAKVRDEKGVGRSLLHIATDWPGFFPNGPAVVRTLIAAGCDPNARMEGGRHTETPLHWAASNDDVEVAAALIECGADIEAAGACIAGGTPLYDAVAFGCWRVAHLLVARGARVDKLWIAAGLGMTARVQQEATAATGQELTDAFWMACSGGHRRTAEWLLAQGAALNGTPSWGKDTPLDAALKLDTGRQSLVQWLRGQGARATESDTGR